MKTKKKIESRIYIIVPEKVTPVDKNFKPTSKTVVMEPGRLMAQCAHVARKLENQQFQYSKGEAVYSGQKQKHISMPNHPYEEITTIVLAVPNSRALKKVDRDLEMAYSDYAEILVSKLKKDLETVLFENGAKSANFYDSNDALYGKGNKALTAIAIGPFPKEDFEKYFGDAIGHLELYK